MTQAEPKVYRIDSQGAATEVESVMIDVVEDFPFIGFDPAISAFMLLLKLQKPLNQIQIQFQKRNQNNLLENQVLILLISLLLVTMLHL